MYPDERLRFLSKQSCSNFYKLISELKHQQSCLILGAGASASVGLPTWTHLLKRICHCYFEEWIFKISSEKARVDFPPSNISIAFSDSYEQNMYKKKFPIEIPNTLTNGEIWVNSSKLCNEAAQKIFKTIETSEKLVSQMQEEFMEKIMSGDLTIISQMIKNQIRPRDWNYLVRKSLYRSYEDHPYALHISSLYTELIQLVKKHAIRNIINYNYDDTFYHALREKSLRYKNCYGSTNTNEYNRIYYPHGIIPVKGGTTTPIVLCEEEYQNQIYQQNLWSNGIQTAMFSSNMCIFIGLSLNDSNIRRLVNMCSTARQCMHYAFLPNSGENQVSTMIDSLCDADLYRLGIRVIRYPSTNNHAELVNLIHCLCDLS